MRNIKLLISYDGKRYNGWQRQVSTDQTIQTKLEQLLSKMTEEEIEVHGSGRTDKGVHATGQVANFYSNTKMSTDEILDYMNTYLPQDIAILDVKDASPRFHSRLNVLKKTYVYRVWNSPTRNVLERNYIYHVPEKLDLNAMLEAATYLLGTNDYQSFCARKMKKSSIRTIHSIDIEKIGDELRFTYCGSGFLYNMVRILTGTLIEVGKHEREPKSMPALIAAKQRSLAGHTAPAHALCLSKVDY